MTPVDPSGEKEPLIEGVPGENADSVAVLGQPATPGGEEPSDDGGASPIATDPSVSDEPCVDEANFGSKETAPSELDASDVASSEETTEPAHSDAETVVEPAENAAVLDAPESKPSTSSSETPEIELQPEGEVDAIETTEAADESPDEGPVLTAGEMMQDFFVQLLAAMGVTATVRIKEDGPEQVTLDLLDCPDASLIIGRHGQTVDDLQYLSSLILNNDRRDRKRFLLNVENYRERREEMLRRSATALAKQVAESGQEAVLDPLPPHERRIVHLALVDIPDVYTYSEGEEPDRRIVISPRHTTTAPEPDPLYDQAPDIEPASEIVEVPVADAEADPASSASFTMDDPAAEAFEDSLEFDTSVFGSSTDVGESEPEDDESTPTEDV